MFLCHLAKVTFIIGLNIMLKTLKCQIAVQILIFVHFFSGGGGGLELGWGLPYKKDRGAHLKF